MKFSKEKKIHLAAAKFSNRYGMEDVRFDGKRLVATDGRMLAVVHVEAHVDDMECPNGVASISAEALKAATKGKGEAQINANAANRLVVKQHVGELDLPRDTDKQKFANWEQIIPTETPEFTINISAELLLRLAKAIGAENGYVELKVIDSKSPIRVKATLGSSDDFGVIMPVLGD